MTVRLSSACRSAQASSVVKYVGRPRSGQGGPRTARVRTRVNGCGRRRRGRARAARERCAAAVRWRYPGRRRTTQLSELPHDRLADLGIRDLLSADIGHGLPQQAFPIGTRARLDADAGVLTFLAPPCLPDPRRTDALRRRRVDPWRLKRPRLAHAQPVTWTHGITAALKEPAQVPKPDRLEDLAQGWLGPLYGWL